MAKMAINIFFEKFFSHNTGIASSYLLADLVVLLLFIYLVMTIYPAVKSTVNFRNMTKEIGGPQGHWFFGNAVTV